MGILRPSTYNRIGLLADLLYLKSTPPPILYKQSTPTRKYKSAEELAHVLGFLMES
jgi:hypothetical protein